MYLSMKYNWNGYKGKNPIFLHWHFIYFHPEKLKISYGDSYWILKYFCIEVVLIFLTENLLHPDTHCEIPHPDVGKYFKEFTGQYYVMNSEKAQEYPDDDVKTRTTVEGRGQWETERLSQGNQE